MTCIKWRGVPTSFRHLAWGTFGPRRQAKEPPDAQVLAPMERRRIHDRITIQSIFAR
ncbi:MAG: hypothetical protein PF443_08410 [Allgaiera sp.]|nr:hypothetical protein [Allgaiera sp.]